MQKQMEKRWSSKPVDLKVAEELSTNTKLPFSVCKLLVSLGITSPKQAKEFLKPDFKSQLHDPFLMTDMQKAVDRINRAIDNKEKILGHGDYDCDGVTSTTMMKVGFQLLGLEIDTYAPNRFKDGYGLNPKNMNKFCREYDLIISADTGIRAFEAAKIANEIGHADLIVTDHHEPMIDHVSRLHTVPEDAIVETHGDEFIALPDAYATIDPQRLGDKYPCKTLAGVAVIFKTLLAVFLSRGINPKELFYHLDLVATGCIADLAQQIDKHGPSLDFEVRMLCKYGIQVMNKKPSVWVQAIKEATNIKDPIDSTHIGFRIGPLLNAPGRLEDPTPAVNLLLEKDLEKAKEMAKELKKINSKRQEQTKEYEQVIESLLQEGEENYDYGIVVESDVFHIGIAGLVAGKLCEYFYRPSIALAPVEKDGKVVLKGSARSIPGIHVLRMLDKVRDEIGDFVYGGHEQAAGMTLEPERFEDFRRAFRNACMQHDEKVFVPSIYYDVEVDLEEVDFALLKFLDMFEPFGQENPKPVFKASNVRLSFIKEIMDGKGARFTFEQNSTSINGVSFKNGEKFVSLYHDVLTHSDDCFVDILFSPSINEWNGNVSVQLLVEDMRIHEE